MHILVAIALFLLGMGLGYLCGWLRARREPYMPILEEIQREVAPNLEKETDPAKKRELCGRLRKLTAELKANGGPKVLVEAAEADLKALCPN